MDRLLFKNILYTFVAQAIGIFASICMSGIIPKMTTVANFGYWQLFVLYSSFIGLLHFGLIDGLYLKYGGKRLDKIPSNLIYSQFLYFSIFQLLLCIAGIFYVLTRYMDSESVVLLFACAYIPIKNIYSYFSMLLLATNNIVCNSYCDMLRKGSLIILILLTALFVSNVTFHIIILIYIVSEIIPFFLVIKPYRKMFSAAKLVQIKIVTKQILENIRNGIFLTISNIISTLILGVARFFIKDRWDIETFGKVSLALSLAFFLTMIITQTSLSLFPFIRNADDEKRKMLYHSLNKILSLLFYFIFILYFPLAYITEIWLPDYAESVSYLSMLVVLCLYEGKMQLLNTTYLKCMNKQRTLMYINIVTLLLSAFLTGIAAYCFSNLTVVLFSMVFCLFFRFWVSCIAINRFMGTKNNKPNMYLDIGMSLFFVLLQTICYWSMALCVMSVLVCIVLFVNKEFVTETLKSCKIK